MSNSSLGHGGAGPAEASSSRNISTEQEVDNGDATLLGVSSFDQTLLSADPLEGGLDEPISFKRKQKAPTRFQLPKFLSSSLSSYSRRASPSPQPSLSRAQQIRSQHPIHNSNSNLPALNISANGAAQGIDAKDGGPLDWYVEGPGRRVGYDDLTAIDWIFEYTKERQRLRVLHSSATGFFGQIRQLLDASQVWLVLIAAGIATGVLAAGIDVASDWLGDLKTGYCKSGPGGGRFYLNKGFCCWGHEQWSQCQDWTPWSDALRVRSTGGKYITEYIFYVIYSIFFATSATILVKNYAIYAKHSGIPEIKTVLGGFVIRRFMGTWTLVIKSIGLV
ncbi:MAG: hypothetical protein M1836_000968 [Candelina mexicana]|nr:MAG: hypothetical protein M1836_000968 [Candelina mexicana]